MNNLEVFGYESAKIKDEEIALDFTYFDIFE